MLKAWRLCSCLYMNNRFKSFGFLRLCYHFCWGAPFLSFLIQDVLVLYYKVKQWCTLVLTQLKKRFTNIICINKNPIRAWTEYCYVFLKHTIPFNKVTSACKSSSERFWVAFFLHDCCSDSEDFQAVVVADGDPVGLGGGPLDIIDLSLCCVGQYRVLNGPRHLLDVPD